MLKAYVLLGLLLCTGSNLTQARELVLAVSDDDEPSSFVENGVIRGIIPDIISIVFENIPELSVKVEAYPWSRAQLMVRNGKADGFMTYPSKERTQYVLFSKYPLMYEDYGYLIFDKRNPNAATIEKATSFAMLKDLKAVKQTGAGWEQDNIPTYITYVESLNPEGVLHLLMHRQSGDFAIMAPEQARMLACLQSDLTTTHI